MKLFSKIMIVSMTIISTMQMVQAEYSKIHIEVRGLTEDLRFCRRDKDSNGFWKDWRIKGHNGKHWIRETGNSQYGITNILWNNYMPNDPRHNKITSRSSWVKSEYPDEYAQGFGRVVCVTPGNKFYDKKTWTLKPNFNNNHWLQISMELE